MKPVLSPKDLAQAIGVSESSLKRWADDGIIRVSRTAGGHRRIPIAEAIRFIRESQSPLIHPEIIGLPEVQAAQSDLSTGGDETEQFYHYLREGSVLKARGLIMAIYMRGESVASICDGPVKTAMERFGELWRHDDEGIFFEHRATDICIQAIQQLRGALAVPPGSPATVGGAPPGDPYILPSLSAAVALTAEGRQAINLGPETPLDTLLFAARRHGARLVWISVSTEQGARAVANGAPSLAENLTTIGAKLAIGGRLRPSINIPDGGSVFFGDSIAELTAYAKGLMIDHGA